MVQRRVSISIGIAAILFMIGLLINIKQITPAPHMDDLGSGSLLDSLFAIALTGLVLFLAAGLGSLLIKSFRLSSWTFIERVVIGIPLGLAALAYGVFFMGLAGWIKPIHLICWLIVICIISFKSSINFLEEAFSLLPGIKKTWMDFSAIKKVIFSVGIFALFLALIQTFTPPWDYDGLAYHLQGPRLFLASGRILPIPENWFTYYPFTWEMIYLLGMGLGSDIFARLIHFSTMILLLLATYAFGRRFLPEPGGWIAAAIMLGVPILLLWGNAAYTDIAWGLLQFLAIALFLIWMQNRNPWLLGLSGVMQGLALGSKYLALSGAGILLIFVLWFSVNRRVVWKQLFYNGMIFGLAAFITAFPWYLKNLLWTGNPFFPLYFSQNIIDPARLKIWFDYVNSFGTGKLWYDYLLLPINIFFQHEKFGTFMSTMEMANPVIIFGLIYPFIRQNQEDLARKTLDVLTIITGIIFIAWAMGSQQIRFLLPLFPGLSIIASQVLMQLSLKLGKYHLGRIIKISMVGGMVISSFIFMCMYMMLIRPEKVLFGMESKSEFLLRMIRDYPGINYANENLTEDEKMLLLWDGRGYYCENACLPEVDQSGWRAAVGNMPTIHAVTNQLKKQKITHILLSIEDVSFFLLKHDGDRSNRRAVDFLIKEFIPKCTDLIYKDEWSRIYEIKFNDLTCQ